MAGFFVITWKNLHVGMDGKELITHLMKEYASFTETELINRAKELLSVEAESWPQECTVVVVENEPFFFEGEVILFQEKLLSYHKLLTAVVTIIDLLDEADKKQTFIMNVREQVKEFDSQISEKFKMDFAGEAYGDVMYGTRNDDDCKQSGV